MAGMGDRRGGKPPDALRTHLDRRKFVQGLGVLSLAAWAPQAVLAAAGPETAVPAEAAPPVRPLFGALFNPYHSPEDWNLLARRRAEGMPLLGSYSSDAAGSIATQLIWSRMMGLHFFLAAYSPARNSQSRWLDALFDAAGRDAYQVGLYIDLQDHAGRPPQQSPAARLSAALDDVTARYLSHPAYLRTASGLPVLAVAGLDSGRMLDQALAATEARRALGPVLRLPEPWRSAPDAEAEPELAQAIHCGRLYPGFSIRNDGRAISRVIPCHSQKVSAILASVVRDEAGGIQLPAGTAGSGSPSYVVLDSFNQWGVSVPLEPGTISQTRYMQYVAQWAWSYVA